jgi:carbon monoxide dehydrogenase subunit G
MYDAKIEADATIDVPAETVFDFLVSPEKIPLAMPGLIENYNIPDLPLKVGSQFNYRYQLLAVVLEGTWTVTTLERPTRYEARTTGGGLSEWRYLLTAADGSTRVSLTVEYETPRSLLEKARVAVVQATSQREAEEYLQNLKMALELQRE